MAEENREFIDKGRKVALLYDGLCGKYNGQNGKFIKKELNNIMSRDPDFFDAHLLLYEILQNEENRDKAEKVLTKAYGRAQKLILNEDGNWPASLAWNSVGNRHIIRVFINKALALWMGGDNDVALEIFRNLLKADPIDHVGAKEFVLAIRMNITAKDFQSRFNGEGNSDNNLDAWFKENHSKFPDEFDELNEAEVKSEEA